MAVETLRRGFIEVRQGGAAGRREELRAMIRELDPETLTQVLRAFHLYFSVLDVLEEEVRHEAHREGCWPGSFEETVAELAEHGVTRDEVQFLLGRLSYSPVFTAHPTESRRRTVQEPLRRVHDTTREAYAPGRTEPERAAARNPYLEPLNHIQVELLRRHRTHPQGEPDPWLDPLLRSINAIAAGLRNTG